MFLSCLRRLLGLARKGVWERFFLRGGSDGEDSGRGPCEIGIECSHTLPPLERTAAQRPYGRTLDAIALHADRAGGVRKQDLHPGDWILVTTKNSVYSICALGNDEFYVSGGWFDREGVSPQKVRIDGCTWGGNAIKSDIVAAKGLFLGFSNSVTTTRIRDVQLIRDRGIQITN